MLKIKDSFMKKTIVVWLGALLSCLLWGSAFPCIKIGYGLFQIPSDSVATQILFAGVRFTLAGIISVIGLCILKGKLVLPKPSNYGKIALLSMFQTVGQYIFFYIGLAHTTGVKASIIVAFNVFIAIIIASLIFHQEKLTISKILGCLLGFSGVILVNLTGGSMNMSFSFIGEGFILISTIAYAFSAVLIKNYSSSENPVILSGYQFLFGGIVMTLIGLILGGRLSTFTIPGVMMLLYLGFLSACAYGVWGLLLKYNPISRVSVFGFMNPVFGVILSALLLNETNTLNLLSIASLALVCAGIIVVNRKKA